MRAKRKRIYALYWIAVAVVWIAALIIQGVNQGQADQLMCCNLISWVVVYYLAEQV